MMGVASRSRTALTAATLVALGACASPGMPPGGPPDSDVPALVRIVPDSNATNVRSDVVRLHFDEVISERPGNPRAAAGTGAARGGPSPSAPGGSIGADLASIVLISPSDGRERMEWRRTAIEIKPRGGFRPNTTYRVSVLPGVADLRGNVIATPLEFVFSTGAEIPAGEINGVVFDWAAAGPARLARVEVFPVGDSAYRWSARADSLGRFTVRDLSPGRYTLRAWMDGDNDRRLGSRESFDSATVTMDRTAQLELYAFVHDTLPARLESVEVADSLTLRLRFDRVLLASWDPTGAVEIVGADSVVRPLGQVMPRVRLDSIRLAAAAAAQAAADTSAADASAANSLIAPERPPDLAAADSTSADSASAGADTIPSGPVFGRAVPVQIWAAPLDAPLAPGLYRMRVRDPRGLNGALGASEREFRVREPAPPSADHPATPSSTRPTTPPARSDTTSRR